MKPDDTVQNILVSNVLVKEGYRKVCRLSGASSSEGILYRYYGFSREKD